MAETVNVDEGVNIAKFEVIAKIAKEQESRNC